MRARAALGAGRRARARGEQGTVVVMTALMVIGSLMMAGLVLDLGELRADRRTNKSVTDMAARAGVGRLPFGPWNGACKARDYLIANAGGFSAFDAGSETWSTAAAQLVTTNPCPSLAFSEDPNPCVPNNPATWAKLQATAGGGRFTVEIQAGYALPDPRFPEDVGLGDTGAPELGGCDNLAVILTERQAPVFAQAGGATAKDVRVRSVGRLNAEETLDFVAALQLLDRHNCDVLVTGGSGTKVIAQPYNTYPGTIQIDSDGGPLGNCTSNKRILVGQDTSGGGTIVACSTDGLPAHGCEPTTGSNNSRIGIYAANFKPAAQVTSNYSASGTTSYGDTMAKPSPRTGRKYVDQRYRQNLIALDQEVKGMLNATNPYPPGCLTTSVPGGIGTCIGLGVTWLVVEGDEVLPVALVDV
ncbi:MAG TPA: Tad domain-containing protein, partial [Acidimicrobiales bacterium]|nr:Tad domain-containing protein [Acidimicrobiales bacterium]